MIKKPPISGFPWHPKSFGEQVLKRRLELGLTQQELAIQLKINDQTISRWEKDEHFPKPKYYRFVVSFLNNGDLNINGSS